MTCLCGVQNVKPELNKNARQIEEQITTLWDGVASQKVSCDDRL